MDNEIKELEDQIERDKQLIRVTETNSSNGFYDRKVEQLKERIAKLQDELDWIIDSHNRAPDIIRNARNNILKNRKKLKALKYKREIERLLRLQEQINELENDHCTP